MALISIIPIEKTFQFESYKKLVKVYIHYKISSIYKLAGTGFLC